MKLSRRALFRSLCAAIGVALALLWFWANPKLADLPAPHPPVAKSPGVRPPSSHAGNFSAATNPPAAPLAESLDKNAGRPATGTGESYLDHHFRAFIAEHGDELALSPPEVDRLVADLLEYQEIHAELVSRLMQETASDPATIAIRVPSFPMQGKALRELLEQRLKTDFPGETAKRIREQAGSFIDDSFRGFGVTEQTFAVKRSDQDPNAFEIAWEAKAPENQTPNGLDRDTTYGGSSGTILFARDQIKSGEFRFLNDAIERKFPATGPLRQ